MFWQLIKTNNKNKKSCKKLWIFTNLFQFYSMKVQPRCASNSTCLASSQLFCAPSAITIGLAMVGPTCQYLDEEDKNRASSSILQQQDIQNAKVLNTKAKTHLQLMVNMDQTWLEWVKSQVIWRKKWISERKSPIKVGLSKATVLEIWAVFSLCCSFLRLYLISRNFPNFWHFLKIRQNATRRRRGRRGGRQ